MSHFRCDFLDRSDRVVFTAEITAKDLECAKRHAFGILQEKQESDPPTRATGVAIWVDDVRVFPFDR